MPDGTGSYPQLSVVDITELVQGIDREYIVRLVKQEEYLRRRVFAGFRPSHLPWKQVPRRLAQDAAGHPGRTAHLLNLWKLSNQDLLDEVSSLPPDNLREGVVRLLVRRGPGDRKQILWALRLDERPEVDKALEEGLERDLVEEASALISQAENTILTEELETIREQLAEAEVRRDTAEAEVEKLQELTRRRADEVQKWRASYDEASIEQAWLKDEIKALKEQRGSDQEIIARLQRQLAEEQEHVQELRRSVTDLRSSLQAQAENRDLDEALLELEDERKYSARLRLKVDGLTHDLREAYDKRDKVREHTDSLGQEVERLKHDKEVIIEEKRRLQKRVENLQAEIKELRMQRDERAYDRALAAVPFEDIDSVWQHAREDVRTHIHSILSTLRADPQHQIEIDKSGLWQAWVGRELGLVEKGLAELDTYPDTGRLPDTAALDEAQELLTLRWYLLEYMRQAIQHAEMTSFLV